MREFLKSKVDCFKRDVRGVFAIIIAITLPIFIFISGFAVDYTNYITISRIVEASLDSASLAAAIDLDQGGTLERSARKKAEQAFVLNLQETSVIDFNAVTGSLNIQQKPGTNEITATANLKVPTYFSSIFGLNTINRNLVSSADFGNGLEQKTELVFVLDNTGSMARQINNPNGRKNNERINALKSAMLETIDIVLPLDGQNDDLVRVGLVPYATSVNLGSYYLDSVNIFSDSVLGNVNNPTQRFLQRARRLNATLNEDQKQRVFDNLAHQCVSEREGANSFGDRAPSQNVDTYRKFKQQRASFYETDKLLRSVSRFKRLPICPDVAIRPLTNNRADLIFDIKSMKPSGYTAGHNGINWGLNLLSENWQSFWPKASKPASYNEENVRKVLIVMTDGEFNTHLFDNKPGIRNPGSRAARNVAFKSARNFCDLAKEANRNVEVYTVALGPQIEVGNPETAANLVLRDCSSLDSPGEVPHFLTASSVGELTAVFKAIVQQEIGTPVLTQ